ncbi:MAG TPA: hypothetical protein VM509_11090 [Planctomycetota bacterium]|nr:hypothetical protein [Planctomycetota bacterium]
MASLNSGNLGRAPWLLFAVLAACVPEEPAQPELHLLDVRPRQRLGVYLNEPLVLHFSAELDRATVTSESVRIVSSDGTAARGERFLSGRELTFVPDPVCARNLLDGGYLPDTSYRLELAGFPRADAIRSVDGACLASTLRTAFHTVGVADRSSGYVFLDDSPDVGKALLLHTGKSATGERRITSQGALELEGEEPLDPSTLTDDMFTLWSDGAGTNAQYRLRPVLLDNRNKHAGKGTTRLKLVPEKLVPPGSYRLRIPSVQPGIEDFSGHKVPVIGMDTLQQLRIRVTAEPAPEGQHLEEFLDPSMRSSALVPEADGTAFWSSTGRVEVRFPAAAGDGSDGEQEWRENRAATLVQAVRITVPQGAACAIDGGTGLCRVSAQGAFVVAGKFERVSSASGELFPPVTPGETLTEFLARVEHEDAPLTVLVAGGDLRIAGELAVPGPLLLVAGGRIRVSGKVRIAGHPPIGPGDFAHCGDSGAISVAYDFDDNKVAERRILGTHARDTGLELDPPLTNPLRQPLFYAVRSKSIPNVDRASSWLSADEIRGYEGVGNLRVRFAGERLASEGQSEVLVDDPALLIDCPTLRLLVELRVPAARVPAERWDPPLLDAVLIRWKPAK